MEFTYPPVTCVDFNFDDQFRAADDYLCRATAGQDLGELMHTVDSFLVERESVLPPSDFR